MARGQGDRSTYRRGFFLGPGLPLGLGVPFTSNAEPRLRFKAAPGAFRFLDESVEFASPFVGAGVALDSDGLSFVSNGFGEELSSTTGAGEEATDGVDGSSSCVEGGSRVLRKARGTLSTTTCDCFLFFSAREVEAEGDRVLEADETAMLQACGFGLTSDGEDGEGVVNGGVVEEWQGGEMGWCCSWTKTRSKVEKFVGQEAAVAKSLTLCPDRWVRGGRTW